MKQWQLDANREDLLLEINTLVAETKVTLDAKEILRLTKEITLCLQVAERQGITYSEEELSL